MPKKNCNENKVDIAVLDNRVKTIEKFVEEMNTNHLPHLYKGITDTKEQLTAEINSVKLNQAYWAGGITAVVVIAQILISIYIK